MANRNAKLIERTLKDFSLGVMSGGGGTVVVNELPEIGEPHTIYELQKYVDDSYGWLFTVDSFVNTPFGENKQFLVFDTYKQMQDTINAISIGENTLDIDYFAYIRNTNQLYYFWVEYPETGDPYWAFSEQEKKKDPSGTDYAFHLEVFPDYTTFYILKQFVGNVLPVPDGGYYCSYLTLDNKEVKLGNGQEFYGLLLRNTTYPNKTVGNYGFEEWEADAVLDHFPTSVEAEELFYNQLKNGRGFFVLCNTSDDKYYDLLDQTENYHWYKTNQQTLDGYYAEVVEDVPGEEPPHYTGELEWEEITWFEEIETLDEIPYERIINSAQGDIPEWNFTPRKEGIVSTYWYYANDEWVNMDEPSESSANPCELKDGKVLTIDLSQEVLEIVGGEDSGELWNPTDIKVGFYVEEECETSMFDTLYKNKIYDIYNNSYNEFIIKVELFSNEGQNQLLMKLTGLMGPYYMNLSQPVVVYEGDVSGMTDTSSIMNSLPTVSITLTKESMNLSDYIPSGAHLMALSSDWVNDGITYFGVTYDQDYTIHVEVE